MIGRQPRSSCATPPCTLTTWPLIPADRGVASHTAIAAGFSGAKRSNSPSFAFMKSPATASVSRVRATGAIAFDAHADALELAGHHDRHRRDAGLGRRVVHLTGVAVEAGLGRGVHDRGVDRTARVLAALAPVRRRRSGS